MQKQINLYRTSEGVINLFDLDEAVWGKIYSIEKRQDNSNNNLVERLKHWGQKHGIPVTVRC
jgi:hypothetical protein